ncbi:MAG: MAPEG family protein [Erythrobacter sp.]|jgi:hypothetical protein|nr:MAPEG family protein [Erythrobacter sp.]
MQAQMLAPAAVLIAWSIVMLFWVAFTRGPEMAKLKNARAERPGEGVEFTKSAGGRGGDLDKLIAKRAVWPSHNYTHLMEQPTIFYPVVVILAIMGAGAGDVLAAWIYVALRIVHSFWQSLVNTLAIRAALFFAATLALIYLAYRAIAVTVFHDPGAFP